VQRTFNGTPFIAAALLYLAITLPLTALSRHLERRGPLGAQAHRTRGNARTDGCRRRPGHCGSGK
jgi:hypothetical protein